MNINMNKKGKLIFAGVVIASLLGSNSYMYVQMSKAKEEVKEEKHEVEKVHESKEQLEVTIGQLMSKSSQYASHEDMIYAFNMYSASNRFNYNGFDYYADIKEVIAHSFNKKEEVQYSANAKMTFLKDKKVNGTSYIQNELPKMVMEDSVNLAKKIGDFKHQEEGHSDEEHATAFIPQDESVSIEKKHKESFVIHKWNQTLLFKMDGQYIMLPTSEMEESIMKEFITAIVLKDKGINAKNAEVTIESLNELQLITVKVEGQTLVLSYNRDTKELKETK